MKEKDNFTGIKCYTKGKLYLSIDTSEETKCKDITITKSKYNPFIELDKEKPQTLTRWQDPTIEEQNKKLYKIKEIVNNEKICGIEAKLMIKDILEGKENES